MLVKKAMLDKKLTIKFYWSVNVETENDIL